jgi:uncharacterized membrane protein YraQ (UPF0718 family)
MISYLETLWSILEEMSPFVILGMLAAGFVHEALGRFQKLRQFARKRSLWTLSFFNLAGFTLPVCSCGTVPLAVGLRQQGVPFGNVFSFIFSAPATSIAAVILSMAMLGPVFTVYYVAGAVICGYAVGLLFYLVEGRRAPSPSQAPILLCAEAAGSGAQGGFFGRAIRWGTVTYGSRIAFDLIVGLALAAFLVSTYSVQSLGNWLGDQPYWQAALTMILVAIPLYICSLPGIIVGTTLILGGVTPELVWVFLMAGPVTNLGDINVLRHQLGWRNTSLYVAAVVIVTFLWGWAIHYHVDAMTVWSHVREYYAGQWALVDGGEGLGNVLAQSHWLGIPAPLYLASAVLLVLFTLNGARLTLQEFWTNPCLHCKHFQKDMSLKPALCPHPCWKKRLLLTLKRRTVPRHGWPGSRQAS